MVARALLGQTWPEAELARQLHSDADGTRPRRIRAWLQQHGLRVRALPEGADDLHTSCQHHADLVCYRMPVQEVGHYAIVAAFDREVVLADPWFGAHHVLGRDDFLQRWAHVEGVEGDLHKWALRVENGKTCACA